MLKIGDRKKMENSCTVNGQFPYSKSDNFMKRMHCAYNKIWKFV